MNAIAVILARGGSKTIKNKNIIDVAGYELISYSIQAAKDSKIFDKIVVSTDSKKLPRFLIYMVQKLLFIEIKNFQQIRLLH